MEPSLMADFLDRQRRAQAAVAPHAKHLAAERSLRAAATAEPVPPTRWRPPPPRSGPGANRSGGTADGRWCRSTLRRFARRSRRILRSSTT